MENKDVIHNLPGFYTEIEHYGLPNQASHTTVFAPALFMRDAINVSSVSTPGWKKLKRYQLPNKNHALHRAWVYPGRASWEGKWEPTIGWPDYTRTVYDGVGSGIALDLYESPLPGEDPTNTAISRLQKEVSQSSGSLMVTLAEGHKTAKMISETAQKLAMCYRSLRKGNLGFAAESIGLTFTKSRQLAYRRNLKVIRRRSSLDAEQFVSQQWLAMSYGWKPLLSDVYAQSENFARVLIDRQFVIRQVSASAKTEWRNVEVRPIAGGAWHNRRSDIITNTVRYTVRYSIQDGPAKVASVFGLQNPLLVAWELVPFSFVADWFLPVGNFLEGLTAYGGLTFSSGTMKTLRVNQVEDSFYRLDGTVAFNGLYLTALQVKGSGNATYLHKMRYSLTDFPFLGFPKFKDPRSFAHAASAIALIQSVFRGSRAR